jgi:hypothetical protein
MQNKSLHGSRKSPRSLNIQPTPAPAIGEAVGNAVASAAAAPAENITGKKRVNSGTNLINTRLSTTNQTELDDLKNYITELLINIDVNDKLNIIHYLKILSENYSQDIVVYQNDLFYNDFNKSIQKIFIENRLREEILGFNEWNGGKVRAVLDNFITKLRVSNTQKQYRRLYDEIRRLFALKGDVKNNEEHFIDRLTDIYNDIDIRDSNINSNIITNDLNHTYTFQIYEDPKTINVKHHLFGDLLMLRSEIPHDFGGTNAIPNLVYYQKIINLCILEYVTNTYENHRPQVINKIRDFMFTTKKIKGKVTDDIFPINLTEHLSSYAALHIIKKRGIPLIKYSQSELQIEVNEDLNTYNTCILPPIFNNKYVINVSDANNTGNMFFSQVAKDHFKPTKASEYPFLNFDAGNIPTFFQVNEEIDRANQLNPSTQRQRPEDSDTDDYINNQNQPPIITVESLNFEYKLKIEPKLIIYEITSEYGCKMAYYYYIKFEYIGDQPENINDQYIIKQINYYLNSLYIRNVSIPNIKNIVNAILVLLNQMPTTQEQVVPKKGRLDSDVPKKDRSANEVAGDLIAINLILDNHRKNNTKGALQDIYKIYSKLFVFNSANNKLTLKPQDFSFYNQNINNMSTFLSECVKNFNTHITDPSQSNNNIRKHVLICKILVNLISIKSLGDLVPYYYTLFDIMIEKQYAHQQELFNKINPGHITNLYDYFLTRDNTPFGTLSSADYSLIQTPLINVKFFNQQEDTSAMDPQDIFVLNDEKNKLFNSCQMVSCVHIYNNDIILPMGETTVNIFRLMGIVENNALIDEQNTNYVSLQNIANNINRLNITMNITQNVNILSDITSNASYIITESCKNNEIIQSPTNFERAPYREILQIKELLKKTARDCLIEKIKPKSLSSTEELLTFNSLFLFNKNTIEQFNVFISQYDIFINLLTQEKERTVINFNKNKRDNIIMIDNPGLLNTLNTLIASTSLDFINKLEEKTINKQDNIIIKKPNLYFLCEYIIKCFLQDNFLRQQLYLLNNTRIIKVKEEPSMDTEHSGGNKRTTKKHYKSIKHKYTKKFVTNMHNSKKTTRKQYLKNKSKK